MINQEKMGNQVHPEDDGRIHSEMLFLRGGTSLGGIIHVAEEEEEPLYCKNRGFKPPY
jgi:hypothetical protein